MLRGGLVHDFRAESPCRSGFRGHPDRSGSPQSRPGRTTAIRWPTRHSPCPPRPLPVQTRPPCSFMFMSSPPSSVSLSLEPCAVRLPTRKRNAALSQRALRQPPPTSGHPNESEKTEILRGPVGRGVSAPWTAAIHGDVTDPLPSMNLFQSESSKTLDRVFRDFGPCLPRLWTVSSETLDRRHHPVWPTPPASGPGPMG